MRILIVGGGGREHALAWKCAQSARVERVLVAPGNAGTRREPKTDNVDIAAEDLERLVALARDARVDLTIVGPEAPLVAGLADAFRHEGLACLGPSAAAAHLEGSKAFAKEFLRDHAIPSAAFQTFDDLAAAERYVLERGAPIVVKADGLAAGKGVTVAHTTEEALVALRGMLSGERFGRAGRRVVIEDRLDGEEASFTALVSGDSVLPLASSQDHKARDDGDLGPNTGGMGAYSPAPILDAEVHARVMRDVIHPTVRGLSSRGIHYVGFLYAGLMIASDGTPHVLEFNCRLGDPETQPIMMRMRSDLPSLCEAVVLGRLAGCEAVWDPRPALGVVMAAGGYPGEYRRGDPISGLDEDYEGSKVFHAGTRAAGRETVTSGGRVLCVCAIADSIARAQALAYDRVGTISWVDAFYRHDIGYRAIARDP